MKFFNHKCGAIYLYYLFVLFFNNDVICDYAGQTLTYVYLKLFVLVHMYCVCAVDKT